MWTLPDRRKDKRLCAKKVQALLGAGKSRAEIRDAVKRYHASLDAPKWEKNTKTWFREKLDDWIEAPHRPAPESAADRQTRIMVRNAKISMGMDVGPSDDPETEQERKERLWREEVMRNYGLTPTYQPS